jgi:uncharacterized repeat protein (TIGR01451 family)
MYHFLKHKPKRENIMKIKTISTLVSIVTLSAITNMAWAAGTAAGTDIDNMAMVIYSVGGVSQTPIESSEAGNSVPGNGTPTTFKVDKKIDLLVTAGSGTNVVPGAAAGAPTSLAFTLKNEGNSTESFNLTPSQVAAGDDFDTSGCTVTSPALPVSLAADASTAVTVQCAVPASSGTVTNGATSLVDLLAQESTGLTETAGADTANTVDVVFADDTGTATDGANRNAKHSAANTYTINTADLTVTKVSAVTNDPFNGAVNPKRIPGATIEYTITIANAAGAQDATNLQLNDALQADLTFVSCNPSGVAGVTCSYSAPNVTTSAFTLPGGSTETLTITATVN